MPDTQPEPLTPRQAFLEAFGELLDEYQDAVLEEAELSDAQVEQLMAAGWDAGRAAGLKELRRYDPGTHDPVSCRCWCCEVVQVVATKLRPPVFGRS